MKKYIAAFGLILLTALPVGAATPLSGKTIALDAGRGSSVTDTGSVGSCDDAQVTAAQVNLAVRSKLHTLITAGGGTVHEVVQVPARRDRVADAEAAHSDVLISIHHDGAAKEPIDATQSFVTQRNDEIFASYIHPEVVSALGLPNRGIKHDGYGMTVYGSLPGVLIESYSVTSANGACDYLAYMDGATNTRIEKEASAMYQGLIRYFDAHPAASGRGKS